MRRLLTIATVLVAAAFAVAAYTPPGTYNQGEWDWRLPGTAKTQGSTFRDVNLSTLGQDLIAGEYWTPTVDFSGGTKYYFDPDATPGAGDGSIDNPFSSLGYEIACDSTIERCNATDYVVDNAANGPVVGPGDVCVLLGGNHGRVEFLRYYFSDYLAIVGAPSEDAVVDYFTAERFERIYVENVNYSGKYRYTRAESGDLDDTGYDNKPYMFRASRDSNGNGVASYFVLKDCDLSNTTADSALGLSETAWDSIVCDAIYINRADHVHIQGNTGTGLGAFAKITGTSSVDAVNVNLIGNTLGYMSGDGIRVSYADSIYISGNYLHDFFTVNDDHVDMTQLFNQCDNIVYDGNKLFETTDPTRTPDGTFAGVISTTVGTFDNSTISNNIIYIGRYGGINVAGGESSSIVNNTVVGRDESGAAAVAWVNVDSTSTDMVVANNIAGNFQSDGRAGVTLANNLSYLRDFTGAGFVSYTTDGDPTLWDLRLSATSPAIRAGSSTYAPDTDYAGASRPDRVFDDVGAYVYDDPDVTAPAQITAALDYRNASSLQISWVDPVATDAWYCTVYRGTASGSLDSVAVASMGDEVYYDDTIDSGTDYYFAVTCTDSSGNESAQREVFAEADATAPAAVSDLLVTNYFDQVDLTWSDPAAADLDYINLYRDQTDGSTLFDVVAKGTETYSDTTVDTSGDSTYYYRVAGVDSSGNEATLSNTVTATPEVTPLAFASFSADSVKVQTTNIDAFITATTNSNAFIRPVFSDTLLAAADSSGLAWLSPAATDWSDTYDTGITPPALADSTVRLTWTAPTSGNQTGYRLQGRYDRGDGFTDWATITHQHPDSTGYTHTSSDDTLAVVSGKWDYRLYAYTGVPGNETETSPVAILPSAYFNNATEVHARFDAIEDTLADFSGIVSSSEQTGLWLSQAEAAGDTFYYVFAEDQGTGYTETNATTFTIDGGTGDDIVYSGHNVYVFDYVDNGEIIVMDAMINPADSTNVYTSSVSMNADASSELPISPGDSRELCMWHFGVSGVLADSSITSVSAAYLHISPTTTTWTTGTGGYLTAIAVTDADFSGWVDAGIYSGTQADVSYQWIDVSASTVWPTHISQYDTQESIGAPSDDNTGTYSPDNYIVFTGTAFSAAVDAWRAGTYSEGGFVLDAYGGSGGSSSQRWSRFANSLLPPILVLEVVR